MKNLMEDLHVPLAIAAMAMLESDDQPQWTVQGFGMMRCYLDKEKTWRLNIYHSELMIPDVSTIHTHPWHFDSWIIGGKLTNIRYHVSTEKSFFEHSGTEGETEFNFAKIITGIASPVGDAGAGGVASQGSRWLIPQLPESDQQEYGPGDHYHMEADETHETRYVDGTITLNRRVKVGSGENAIVYWSKDKEWVSAKPRLATDEEIAKVAKAAMNAVYNP